MNGRNRDSSRTLSKALAHHLAAQVHNRDHCRAYAIFSPLRLQSALIEESYRNIAEPISCFVFGGRGWYSQLVWNEVFSLFEVQTA